MADAWARRLAKISGATLSFQPLGDAVVDVSVHGDLVVVAILNGNLVPPGSNRKSKVAGDASSAVLRSCRVLPKFQAEVSETGPRSRASDDPPVDPAAPLGTSA